MKIISWNLKNLGFGKLVNPMTPGFAAYGLGNDVMDYVLGVVMGTARWTNFATANPADLFIVIELKTGGHLKNTAANGTSIPTMNTLRGTMQAMANAGHGIGGNPNYQYAVVPALVTGRHECVGVIYNTVTLAYNGNNVLRDNALNYINPRSPYRTQFTEIATGTVLDVISIHAPPVSGGAATRYRNPITFLRRAATMPEIAGANVMVTGDYNCDPTATYAGLFGAVGWNFGVAYGTQIPANTLSSVRTKVANANPPPANYLSEAYDNLLYNFAPVPPVAESVMNTILNSRNMNVVPIVPIYPGNLVATLNNYNKVSDHLPLCWEF